MARAAIHDDADQRPQIDVAKAIEWLNSYSTAELEKLWVEHTDWPWQSTLSDGNQAP